MSHYVHGYGSKEQQRLVGQAEHGATSQVVRGLERKGLIEREVDEADARARRLRATATVSAKGRTSRKRAV